MSQARARPSAAADAPTAAHIATDRLWLTEPRRATSLSKVVAVRGPHFALDRSLFAPTSHAHRHPQPHDTGICWVRGGEKRVLERSFVQDGLLWHRLRGTVPEVGEKLNCQLDQDRRLLASRAHTAMHLLVRALGAAGAPAMVADPTVKGGGTFRLDLGGRLAPADAAAALAQANAWAASSRAVGVEHVLRELAPRVLEAQSFAPPDAYPGPPDVLSAVRIEGLGAMPCDGTHVDRTPRIGRIVLAQVQPLRSGGTLLVGKVLDAA